MSDENTEIVTKSSLVTTESSEVGPAKVEESFFVSHNLSGRFWIALALTFGFILATVLVLTGQVKLDSNATIAVYTGFAGSATGIIGIYMGQNSKPKGQTT